MEKIYQEILKNESIAMAYQPIVDLKTGQVFAYEALARPQHAGQFISPSGLFEWADQSKQLWALEKVCRIKAIHGAHFIGPYKLFINVNPKTLEENSFRTGFTQGALQEAGIGPEHLVIEVTENARFEQESQIRQTVAHYEDQGFTIALDDVGAGYAGLHLLSEVRPAYIKIDMKLIRDIHLSPFKEQLLNFFQAFASSSNCKVIAEGIESQEELEVLVRIGIDYGQGYFLGKPAFRVQDCSEEARKTITNYQRPGKVTSSLCRLVRRDPALEYQDNWQEVAKAHFTNHPGLHGIVVTKDQIPVGLAIRRRESLQRDILTVSARDSIDQVARRVLSKKEDMPHDYIIVTENGLYKGLIPISRLLQYYMNREDSRGEENFNY